MYSSGSAILPSHDVHSVVQRAHKHDGDVGGKRGTVSTWMTMIAKEDRGTGGLRTTEGYVLWGGGI